jgi:oligopeptidase B
MEVKKVPFKMAHHGDERVDNYYWMRNLDQDSGRKSYIDSCNDEFQSFLKDETFFKQKLFNEMKSKIKGDEDSYPYLDGEWFYYHRFEDGKEYPIHCRKKEMNGDEQVILDENELAYGNDFFALGLFEVSPNHEILAYSIDLEGDERYKIYFKNLKTNEILEDCLENTYYTLQWYNDNQTLLYTVLNEQLRPDAIKKHTLGQSSNDDEVVHLEQSGEYFLHLSKSSDEKFIFITAHGGEESVTYYLNANDSLAGKEVFLPLEDGHQYYLDHKEDHFYFLSNKFHFNFGLYRLSFSAARNWDEVIQPSDTIYIKDFQCFKDFIALETRENARSEILILDEKKRLARKIEFEEDLYELELTDNYVYNSKIVRFKFTSFVTAKRLYDYDTMTKDKAIVYEKEIPNFNPHSYKMERVEAISHDGIKIPVSILSHQNFEKNEENPLYLYSYGSYGSSIWPFFDNFLFTLADRGVTVAIAHIRGGSDCGRQWYENAKFLKKKNTFIDFISVAECLIARGYTKRGNIAINGASAGGLLIGAVLNMAPSDLFKVAVAEVPFVDTLTTMLDKDLPLTQIEYKEWGNPEEEKYYYYMKSYSPYDNIGKREYPLVLATAGLSDPRVTYWEPAKWAAKLNEYNTGSEKAYLYTNTGAGHMGASGRYDHLKEHSLIATFILKAFGIKE